MLPLVAQEDQREVDALDLTKLSLRFGPATSREKIGFEVFQAGKHLMG